MRFGLNYGDRTDAALFSPAFGWFGITRKFRDSSQSIRGTDTMFEELDPVVLDVDIPEQGLPRRSLGAVVHAYSSEAYEVEFVTASGRTAALLTLKMSQLRRPTDNDLICVSQMMPTSNSMRRPQPCQPRRRQ